MSERILEPKPPKAYSDDIGESLRQSWDVRRSARDTRPAFLLTDRDGDSARIESEEE